MNISGLVPGVTYYYRVVSHGSFAVSTEHSFTVPAVKGAQTESEETSGAVAGGAIVSTQGATGAGGGVIQEEGAKENGDVGVIAQEQTEEDSTNPFLAALGGLFSKIDFCSINGTNVSVLTPEIPLFFNKPSGDKQLAIKLYLTIPAFISLSISFVNLIIIKISTNKFLQQTLLGTSIAVTALSSITILKIFLLVANL